MVEIKRVKKKLAGRNFVPSVIEPSFGIGRILYCIFEHGYYTREVRRGEGGGLFGCVHVGVGGGACVYVCVHTNDMHACI